MTLSPNVDNWVDTKYAPALLITDPNLQNWRKSSIDPKGKFSVIQPCILVHPKGKLQMLCRSRDNAIVETWSNDKGKTWSELKELGLPNPNSGIDAVTLSNGLHVLVYNPLKSEKDWQLGRNILKVAISTDGFNWKDIYTLEQEKEGEYSYPAVIQSNDGLVHITYTANRTNIKHAIIQIK